MLEIADTEKINDLVRQVRLGDDSSFAALSEIYNPLIESMVRSFKESACVSADDYRQEALVALYSAVFAYRFDTGVTFGLYAKICIRNRLISVSEKMGGDTAGEDDSIDYSPDSEVDPESLAIEEESFNALNNLIDGNLTAFERTVLNLFLLGKSCSECACALGRSEKSISNALFRIRSKIKKLI